MNTRLLTLAAVLTTTLLAVAQSPSSVPNDGLDLLTRVSKHYADAKFYHIRALTEYASGNDLDHYWEKKILESSEAPQGKYRYEGQSGKGSAVRISDGNEVWTYHANEHSYTRATVQILAVHKPIPEAEISVTEASLLRKGAVSWATDYKSATRLPDAKLEVNGKPVSCYVVRLQNLKRETAGWSSEATIWIRKADETIVKTAVHSRGFTMVGAARIPTEGDFTASYPVVELDRPIPDSVFTFAAPADAKIVDEFSDSANPDPSLEGQILPSITVATSDGKSLSTDSLRGKPALLDFWTSWCVACVQEFKIVNSIYERGKDKIAVITIDQDEDSKAASDLLAKNHYSWLNVHDDGEISNKLGGMNGYPRTLLIDSQGKVVYDRPGLDEQKFRDVVSGLGPEYESLISQPPCDAQVSRKK